MTWGRVVLLSWGAEQEQATRQRQGLPPQQSWSSWGWVGRGGEEKRRGEREMRKMINPPNMGTKSDPRIKINDSRKKKELPPSLSSLPGCLTPSAAVARSSSEAALPPSKIKKGEEAELAPPTNSTMKYEIWNNVCLKKKLFFLFYSLTSLSIRAPARAN